jgi:hypothetical protein
MPCTIKFVHTPHELYLSSPLRTYRAEHYWLEACDTADRRSALRGVEQLTSHPL